MISQSMYGEGRTVLKWGVVGVVRACEQSLSTTNRILKTI